MDEQQITSVWLSLRQRLRRYAQSVLGNNDDADDTLQDSFCKLWANRDKINDSQHMQALAVTMVKHASIDAHRQSQTRNVVALNDTNSDGAYTHVYEDLNTKETFEEIEHAVMHNLSERERAVFTMKEYDGLSNEEIATRLGISQDAVRKALSRSRQTIREQYIKINKYRL